jgi:hypothetical protein
MYEQEGIANLMSHITMEKIRRPIATVSNLREIRGPHGGEHAEDRHLECDAVRWSRRSLPTPQTYFLFHFQGRKMTMKMETDS